MITKKQLKSKIKELEKEIYKLKNPKRIIIKYNANSKLYDTQTKQYTTVKKIKELTNIKVLTYPNNNDITYKYIKGL